MPRQVNQQRRIVIATVALATFLPGEITLAQPPGKAADQGASRLDAVETLWFDETRVVEAPSRFARPVNDIAENVTIITAEEIEAMNVHNLSEVINRAPGIAVSFWPQEMNGLTLPYIHASQEKDVLVIFDGVRRNSAANGMAELKDVPVAIVERIEIIKGPASATWGSALAGVINIITKKTGTTALPTGELAASYGEKHTWEAYGRAAGKAGPLGYLLYAGRQDSDGLGGDLRFWEADRFYAKLDTTLPTRTTLTASIGHTDPYYQIGDIFTVDVTEKDRDRNSFLTAGLDQALGDSLHLTLGARQYKRDWEGEDATLGQGTSWFGLTPVGAPLWTSRWRETSTGANAHLTWKGARQTVALGAETSRTELAKETLYGPLMQSFAIPALDPAQPIADETRGVYLNDTIHLGNATVTLGLRHDHNSRVEEQLSPSLGVTWRPHRDWLLRATAARGFTQPLLSFLAVQDLFFIANPGLEAETSKSYQVGAETTALRLLRARLTLFQDNVHNSWQYLATWQNGPDLRRQGLETELETLPFYHVSLAANATYTHIEPHDDRPNDATTTANLIVRYDDRETLIHGELSGHYVWWDTFYSVSGGRGMYYDPVWDLTLAKGLRLGTDRQVKLFGTVHNLGSASQYSDQNYKNPGRWVEAGVKLFF